MDKDKNGHYCVSYKEYKNIMHDIHSEIIDCGVQYTHILGISRGGLIPATFLSHALNLPLALTSYSAPEGKGTGTALLQFNWQDDKHIKIDRSSVVLVVDDIIDSGFTMKHVVEQIGVHVAGVDYAAIFKRDGAVLPNQERHRLICCNLLDEDDPWISFPWEQWETKETL